MKRLLQEKKYRILLFAFTVFLLFLAFVLTFLNPPAIRLPARADEVPSKSFTFFSIGENTRLTQEKLKTLKKALGQHRLENLTPVSMDFVKKGWLSAKLPELRELDAFFSDTRWRGEIASRTLKLTYRYAATHQVPFTDIQFIFSGDTLTPLFLRLRLPGDGDSLVTDLEKKHGKPLAPKDSAPAAASFFWKTPEAHLLTAVMADRYGKPETHILIVYTENAHEFANRLTAEAPQPETSTGF